MSEELFEYGEEVEMSDFHSFSKHVKAKFFAYQPSHINPYVGIRENDGMLLTYRYCRKIRPPFKHGHLIFVRDFDCDEWGPRIFVGFNVDGSVRCCREKKGYVKNWKQYLAIQNYDYTKDPHMPQGEE